MKTKLTSAKLLSLLVCCLFPAVTHATPFTFDFTSNLTGAHTLNTNPLLFGSALSISIVFDNGDTTNKSQVYSYADITNIAVAAMGGTFSVPESDPKTISFTGNPSDLFVTTDAQGRIVVPPPFSQNIVIGDSVSLKSLIDGEGTVFAAWWFTGRWQHSNAISGDEAFGPLKAVAVPEPPSWAFLLMGLAGLGLILRREKKAGNPSLRRFRKG